MGKLTHNFVLPIRFFSLEFMFQSKIILTALLPQRILFCQKPHYIGTAVFISWSLTGNYKLSNEVRSKLWRQEHFYTNTAVSTLGGDTTLVMSVELQQHNFSQLLLRNRRTKVKESGNISFLLQLCLGRLIDKTIFKLCRFFSLTVYNLLWLWTRRNQSCSYRTILLFFPPPLTVAEVCKSS